MGEKHLNGEMEDSEEYTTEELVEENDLLLEALIELLVEKGVFTREEFDAKVDKVNDERYEE